MKQPSLSLRQAGQRQPSEGPLGCSAFSYLVFMVPGLLSCSLTSISICSVDDRPPGHLTIPRKSEMDLNLSSDHREGVEGGNRHQNLSEVRRSLCLGKSVGIGESGVCGGVLPDHSFPSSPSTEGWDKLRQQDCPWYVIRPSQRPQRLATRRGTGSTIRKT